MTEIFGDYLALLLVIGFLVCVCGFVALYETLIEFLIDVINFHMFNWVELETEYTILTKLLLLFMTCIVILLFDLVVLIIIEDSIRSNKHAFSALLLIMCLYLGQCVIVCSYGAIRTYIVSLVIPLMFVLTQFQKPTLGKLLIMCASVALIYLVNEPILFYSTYFALIGAITVAQWYMVCRFVSSQKNIKHAGEFDVYLPTPNTYVIQHQTTVSTKTAFGNIIHTYYLMTRWGLVRTIGLFLIGTIVTIIHYGYHVQAVIIVNSFAPLSVELLYHAVEIIFIKKSKNKDKCMC
jgi:hypothetical protein